MKLFYLLSALLGLACLAYLIFAKEPRLEAGMNVYHAYARRTYDLRLAPQGGPQLRRFEVAPDPDAAPDADPEAVAALRDRASLLNGQHEALSSALRAAFALDLRQEGALFEALRAFNTPLPELEAPLRAWRGADDDWPSALAAGIYAFKRGAYAWRIESRQAATPWLARALAELGRALELEPRLQAAYITQIRAARLLKDAATQRQALEGAVATCPSCFQARFAYLASLRPHKSGDLAPLRAEAARLGAAEGQSALRAYPDAVACSWAWAKGEVHQALAACNRALDIAPLGFAYERRAYAYASRSALDGADTAGDLALALADVDRALRGSMDHLGRLRVRAFVLWRLGRWAEAGEALRRGLLLDPMSMDLIKEAERYLRARLRAAAKRGGVADLEAAIEGAARLHAAHPVVACWRQVLGAGLWVESPRARRLIVLSCERPWFIKPYLRLDDLFIERLDFKTIAAHWDRYIALNPDVAPAHYERGGARLHLGDVEGSLTDMARACALKMAEACQAAKAIQGGARSQILPSLKKLPHWTVSSGLDTP